MDSIIPVTHPIRCFLDASAIGGLVKEPALTEQRDLILKLAPSVIRCATSVEAVSQLVGRTDELERIQLLGFLKATCGRWGVMSSQTPIISAWLRGEETNSLIPPPGMGQWDGDFDAFLRDGREQILSHIRSLQEGEAEIRRRFGEILQSHVAKKPGLHWTNHELFFGECRRLADELVFPFATELRELFRDAAVDLTDDDLTHARDHHPWVKLYTAHVVACTLRSVLWGTTKEKKLKDDPVDRTYLVYASCFNVFVTADAFLRSCIERCLHGAHLMVTTPSEFHATFDQFMRDRASSSIE